MTSIVFQLFQLHDLTLSNRIVLAPVIRGSGNRSRTESSDARILRPAQSNRFC
jgi:2,4-dienoyl-CoA reductase-like NADH-dependent reductase (Old Yellow Enzyme family)